MNNFIKRPPYVSGQGNRAVDENDAAYKYVRFFPRKPLFNDHLLNCKPHSPEPKGHFQRTHQDEVFGSLSGGAVRPSSLCCNKDCGRGQLNLSTWDSGYY